MKTLLICIMLASFIGGMVSAYIRQSKMTLEEQEAEKRRIAEHSKGIASGIVVGSIGTMGYLVKKSKGGKK